MSEVHHGPEKSSSGERGVIARTIKEVVEKGSNIATEQFGGMVKAVPEAIKDITKSATVLGTTPVKEGGGGSKGGGAHHQ